MDTALNGGTARDNVAAPRRTGLVRLVDHSLVDDQGPFNALGATMMWAAWAYKFDRPRLERNLAFLSSHGFDYIRALGVVGDYQREDYWDGREIDWHWPDYADVIAGVTDLAYDRYGLRVEWTLIGDGQLNIPNESDRYALVDTFLAMSRGREQEIIHFEIANEFWQNGFSGDSGLRQLRELSRYMKDRTEILVAASAPDGPDCAAVERVYNGGIADLATIHFDRDTTKTEGSWRPVRQPWEHEYCNDVPVGSNNEPIGPGASVASENDPVRLVSAAIATYVSSLPLYVFHTKAGVRGFSDIADEPGADAFVTLRSVVPPDLASWSRRNAHWGDAPLRVYAYDEQGRAQADVMWPDLRNPTGGAVRAYGGVQGNDFFVFPIGILGKVGLEARSRDMEFVVMDPMSGGIVSRHALRAGERIELSGYDALVVRGRFGRFDDPCVGHCANGVADCNETGVDCGPECGPCAEQCEDCVDCSNAVAIEVRSAYFGILGRAPDPEGWQAFTAARLDGLPLVDACRSMFESDEYATNRGSLTDEQLARSLYLGILDREPDEEGFESTVRDIESGQRAERAAGMLTSEEFLSGHPADGVCRDPRTGSTTPPSGDCGSREGVAVRGAYFGILGRAPDPEGWNAYTSALGEGVPLVDACRSMFESEEFAHNRDSLSAEELARLLYLGILNREPDPGGFAATVVEIENGRRAERAAGMLASDEFLAGHPADGLCRDPEL